MAPPCQAPHGHGIATSGGEHGDNCEAQCGPAVSKKASFTHVRDNLRGDVSGKRFSTHVVEGNVAGNGKRVGVGTTKGLKVHRESDGKRVGSQKCDGAGWKLWGWETGQDKS